MTRGRAAVIKRAKIARGRWLQANRNGLVIINGKLFRVRWTKSRKQFAGRI